MDERSRLIFDEIMQAYMETGEPVGSRTISRRGVKLSPASIRNVMSDLTELGLLASPHISAGRLPTQSGLRVFVDGLLEVGRINLAEEDRQRVERHMARLKCGLAALSINSSFSAFKYFKILSVEMFFLVTK